MKWRLAKKIWSKRIEQKTLSHCFLELSVDIFLLRSSNSCITTLYHRERVMVGTRFAAILSGQQFLLEESSLVNVGNFDTARTLWTRGVVKGGQRVPLSIFVTTKTSVFSTNAQSRFASIDIILGGLHAYRGRPDATHKACRGPLKAPSQLKKPFKGPRWKRGICWENGRRTFSCHPG